MKKITLTVIIFFMAAVGSIYALGFTSSPAIPPAPAAIPSVPPTPAEAVIKPPILSGAVPAVAWPTPPASVAPSLSMAEVTRHSSVRDCYLVVNNNVYDVTSYINYHPGGSDYIISYCGTEVTGIFASIHSNRAWDLLKKFIRGAYG